MVTVVAVYADGTALVAFEGGAQAIATGVSAAEGESVQVVVVGNRLEIKGIVPNLPRVTIDVF